MNKVGGKEKLVFMVECPIINAPPQKKSYINFKK